jgi:hypothetical protein
MDLVSFPLNDCHGYSVKFSPFIERRIACVASQNYGLSGRHEEKCIVDNYIEKIPTAYHLFIVFNVTKDLDFSSFLI